jgi:hypothetical protein
MLNHSPLSRRAKARTLELLGWPEPQLARSRAWSAVAAVEDPSEARGVVLTRAAISAAAGAPDAGCGVQKLGSAAPLGPMARVRREHRV